MENYVFLTPNFGTLMLVLLLGIPAVMLYNLVSPTSTYKFKDYHHDLTIEYQTSGDNVTGTIEYHWDDNNNNYHVETNFTGKVNDNNLIIELEDNNIRTYVGPQGTINKNMDINISNNEIYFQGITAKKI